MKDAVIAMLSITCVCFLAVGGDKCNQLREAKKRISAEIAATEKLEKQKEQLIGIIKRTNTELVLDKDGNYDALIPMTPEEFERLKEELRKRKEEQNK